MPRIYFLTLGFDSSIVLRAVSRNGIGEGDKIILVTSSTPHPKSESAVNDVRGFVGKIGGNISVEVLSVDEHDFPHAVKNICLIINREKNLPNNRLIIDISGGPRIIGLAMYVAAGLCGVNNVWITTETRSKAMSIPVMVDRIEAVIPSKRQLELLETLPARPSVIAKRLGVSKSAVSKMLRIMEEKGLVVREGRVVKPSPKARFLLKVSGETRVET